ncbi:MarR family winged helix-turn-helix transcriptional regulator [Mucilaginibacter paludis]|uniref:Regulatory protein MarR n=1 Tax=Mucilaginibacter paludis DSM 18603 TaxID=714943 RepID=H1Y6H3_9SPHI|nr:MarR family transcriptional regulator [Mucilaginibacter paludis]EHQ25817.1 regulatory protein MarR [Mucilaginibacter paludis DSM 18603]
MDTEDSQRVACKLIYLLKRFTDEWLNKQVCCESLADFNHAHLPLFMSIGTTGISNNALAEKLNVTKQATSKVIKELEAINMVRSEKSQADARSVMLFLTSEGEKYYQHVRTQIFHLEEQYKKVVGAKNFEIAIDVMLKLIQFHEQENQKRVTTQ